MEAVFFTVLACALVGAFICLVYSSNKMYGKDVAETMCIAAVAGMAFTVLVYLVAKELMG